jgi:hypothetical protein
VHLTQSDVKGFDVLKEMQCTFIGYGTVLECSDALLAGHDVFADTFGARVLQELVRSEV